MRLIRRAARKRTNDNVRRPISMSRRNEYGRNLPRDKRRAKTGGVIYRVEQKSVFRSGFVRFLSFFSSSSRLCDYYVLKRIQHFIASRSAIDKLQLSFIRIPPCTLFQQYNIVFCRSLLLILHLLNNINSFRLIYPVDLVVIVTVRYESVIVMMLTIVRYRRLSERIRPEGRTRTNACTAITNANDKRNPFGESFAFMFGSAKSGFLDVSPRTVSRVRPRGKRPTSRSFHPFDIVRTKRNREIFPILIKTDLFPTLYLI